MSEIPLVTLDTNVLVSGLLNPHGAPGRIVDLLLSRQLRIAYDDRVFLEYRVVLSRPKFQFAQTQIDRVLSIFSYQESVFPKPWPNKLLPDPDDVVFLEVAKVSSGILISGNLKHYPKKLRRGVQVLSPADWLAQTFGS